MTNEGFYSYTKRVIDELRNRLESDRHIDCMIRVRPHASKTELTGILDDGSLKIAVAAPAEDGRGNAMLLKFLADLFNVPPSSVSILSGKTARLKLVRITASAPR